jgi:hypothetical protein
MNYTRKNPNDARMTITHDAARVNGVGRHYAFSVVTLVDPGGSAENMVAVFDVDGRDIQVSPKDVNWNPDDIMSGIMLRRTGNTHKAN